MQLAFLLSTYLQANNVDAFSSYHSTRSFSARPVTINIPTSSTLARKARKSSSDHLSSSNTSMISDEEAMAALEKLESLDAKLGIGIGAAKERLRLNDIIEKWEIQSSSDATMEALENEYSEEEEEDDDPSDDDQSSYYWENKFVRKHSSKDRIAIFGGDPARRRQAVAKKLSPYKSCDQFGSPRDVGLSGVKNLLRKINQGKYDVVFVWTRFNCHNSRIAIREACQQAQTRFEEVESLAYIREL